MGYRKLRFCTMQAILHGMEGPHRRKSADNNIAFLSKPYMGHFTLYRNGVSCTPKVAPLRNRVPNRPQAGVGAVDSSVKASRQRPCHGSRVPTRPFRPKRGTRRSTFGAAPQSASVALRGHTSGLGELRGKPHRETRANALAAHDLDGPFVRVHDPLGNGESQPRALGRPLAGALGTVEPLEYVAQVRL